MPPSTTATNTTIVDEELAHRLAVYYAPELRFDSREQYFPCSLEWLAQHSCLWCRTTWDHPVVGAQKRKKYWVLDQRLADLGEANDPHAASAFQCSLGQGQGALHHQHRLRPHPDYWEGQSLEAMETGEVPCYYSVVPAPSHVFDDLMTADSNNNRNEDDLVYEITYYMIYAYNGNIFNVFGLGSPCAIGEHEGDLEQVVVYGKDPNVLTGQSDNNNNNNINNNNDNDKGLLAVFMHRHSGEGRFCEVGHAQSSLEVLSDNSDIDIEDDNNSRGEHCVVYPACESHASYAQASWTCRILGLANDRHNGQGRRWQTWKRLQLVDNNNNQDRQSHHSCSWMAFDGRYGDTDGLAQRTNLGRPGFPSRSCSLPALIPDKSFRWSVKEPPHQIPGRLRRAMMIMSEPSQTTTTTAKMMIPNRHKASRSSGSRSSIRDNHAVLQELELPLVTSDEMR